MHTIIEKALENLFSGKHSGFLPRHEGSWVTRHNSGFVKDAIQYYRYPEAQESLYKRFNEIELIDGHLVLYRGLGPDRPIDSNALGIAWSFEKRKAYCYGSGGPIMHYFVYTALVPVESVNWNWTVQKAMVMHSHEKEVVLVPGRSVRIVNIEKRVKTSTKLLDTTECDFWAII